MYGGEEKNAVLFAASKKRSFAKAIFFAGFFSRRLEEEAMKNRAWIVTLVIAVLAAFSPAPRADAEPLTIMAIVGVATVLSISTVDIVASHYEDNRDQRAQKEETEKMHAKAETAEQPSKPDNVEVAAR